MWIQKKRQMQYTKKRNKKAFTVATLVVFILALLIAAFLVKSIWDLDVLNRSGISIIGGSAGITDVTLAKDNYYEGEFLDSQNHAMNALEDPTAYEHHPHMMLRLALCRSALNDFRGSVNHLQTLIEDYDADIDSATRVAIEDLIQQAKSSTREENNDWVCCDIRGLGKLWVYGICPDTRQANPPCDENKPLVAGAITLS